MDDELRCYIEAIERRFDSLRETDRDQVKTVAEDLQQRLQGFPAEYATKSELKAVADVVAKLDKETISREVYDQQHKALEELVQKLDRDKLPESVFATFVENYRIAERDAATERRAVAQGLATASARSAGGRATWGQIGAVLGGIVAVLTIVVILVNWAFAG